MAVITTCIALSLPAIPSSIRMARVSVGDAAVELGASERVVDDIRLCVSEAVSNVVRHAYGTRPGDVDVVVERGDNDLNVVVRDKGRGMRRSSGRDATGGYGLKIIGAVAERIAITSAREAGTTLRMTFPLRAH